MAGWWCEEKGLFDKERIICCTKAEVNIFVDVRLLGKRSCMAIFPRRNAKKYLCAMWYWKRVPCLAPSSRGSSPWRVCMCPQNCGGSTGSGGWGIDLWPHQFLFSQASAGPQLSTIFPVWIIKKRGGCSDALQYRRMTLKLQCCKILKENVIYFEWQWNVIWCVNI